MSEKTSYTPGTASWVDLMTPDLEGAKQFYASIFDWSYKTGGAQTNFYNIAQVAGKQVAGIMAQDEQSKSVPTAWNTYFDTKNIDASAAQVKEAGGQVMMGPMDVMDLGRMAFCMDPTGAAFGLWQANKHIGSELYGDPGAMAWNELRSRDLKTAVAFYQRVLGNPIENMNMPQMEYHIQKTGEMMHAGFMNVPEGMPKEVPSHWLVYFAVKDADQTAAKIKTLGGKMLGEPFDTPYGRNGFAQDKWGARFAFLQPNPPKK